MGEATVAALASLANALGQGDKLAYIGAGANEQGARDMGLLPDTLPGHAAVADAAVRERLGKLWGVQPPAEAGQSYAQMVAGGVKGAVRDGREPCGPARPGRGAAQARLPGRPRPLPDRDRAIGRRGVARVQLRRGRRHVHQPGASRPARAAGHPRRRREQARLGDPGRAGREVAGRRRSGRPLRSPETGQRPLRGSSSRHCPYRVARLEAQETQRSRPAPRRSRGTIPTPRRCWRKSARPCRSTRRCAGRRWAKAACSGRRGIFDQRISGFGIVQSPIPSIQSPTRQLRSW